MIVSDTQFVSERVIFSGVFSTSTDASVASQHYIFKIIGCCFAQNFDSSTDNQYTLLLALFIHSFDCITSFWQRI